MRIAGVLLAVLLLCSNALAAPPRVVRSEPENGTIGVPVDIGVLRIHFDQDMNTGSWTLWRSDRGELPPLSEIAETPFRDPRTMELALEALQPGTTYAIQLNNSAKGKRGLRAVTGEPLPDTVIAFRTADQGVPSGRDPQDPLPPPVKPGQMNLGPVRPDPDRLWTVLVYMAADNDVERFAPETLNDIEAKFPGQGVEIIVLFDRAKEFDTSHGDWHDTRVYRVKRGTRADALESEQIASLGELNLGSADTLADFISAGLRTFPSRRTCLLMWDHGMGWGGNAVDMDAPGAKKLPEELTLLELADGMARGLAAGGREKLDLVLFHMCLMAQVEIAAEMMPLADFMVASEAMIPCAIVPYGALMASLANQADPRAAAAGMVEVYRQAYRAGKDEGSTSSAIDLTRLSGLLDAIDAVAGKLAGVAGQAWPTLSRSLFFSENYMGRADYRAGEHSTASIDLLDAIRRMRANLENFPAEQEYQALERALAACVLDNYTGERWRLSQGLAIYGPVRAEHLNAGYRQTAFAARGGWLGLLDRVHAVQKQQMSPPKVKDIQLLDGLGRPTKEVMGLSGTHVKLTVEGRNILWVLANQVKPIDEPKGMAVMFRTFIVDHRYEKRKADMASELVDLAMPIYVDGENPIAKEVGGLGFRVTDGKKLIEATIDYSDPGKLQLLRVPAVYRHPADGECRCDIMFDVNWSQAVFVVGYIPMPGGGFMPKQFMPKPDAELTLLYQVITEKNEMIFVPTGTVTWKDGLMIIPVFDDPGRYGMVIEAESIEGSGGSDMIIWDQKANPEFDQLVKAGGNFGGNDLIGEWELQKGVADPNSGQLRFEQTDITVQYGVDPGEPNVLQYRFQSPSTKLPEGVVFTETRGAPCLIYFERDDRGEWKRTEMHIAFHLPEQGVDQFILKDVFMGLVYRLVRKGGTPTPPQPPTPEPPTPQPQSLAAALIGTWKSADGNMILAMNGSQYQVAMGGQVVEQGTYRVQDDKLYFTNHLNQSGIITVTHRGDSMSFKYHSNGMVVELTRVR